MRDNPVAKRMRKIYCCAGAAFAGPDLQAGWEEIERLEKKLSELESSIMAIQSAQKLSDDHDLPLLEDLDAAIKAAVGLCQLVPNQGKNEHNSGNNNEHNQGTVHKNLL